MKRQVLDALKAAPDGDGYGLEDLCLMLDLERFGRASFHGVTAKAFNTWTVAVWMRPIDLEVGA